MNEIRHLKIDETASFKRDIAKSAGYDAESALNELIDNSIGARATEILIQIKNGKLKISDCGENSGMDEKTLEQNFFKYGKSSSIYDDDAPGYFGAGAKTSILSLIGESDCDVEITTHKKGYQPIYAVWRIRENNVGEADWYFLKDNNLPYGTTIEFNCEISRETVDTIKKNCGVRYYRAISNGTSIIINNERILAADPLYRNSKQVREQKLFCSEKFNVNGEIVIVNMVAFPSRDTIPTKNLHKFDVEGVRGGVTTANRSGIYLNVANRCITMGNNFGPVMSMTTHAATNGLRIEIVAPKVFLKDLGVCWNKTNGIKPFKDVKPFVDAGIVDYIYTKMLEFVNSGRKHKTQSLQTIQKIIDENINKFNLSEKFMIVPENDSNEEKQFRYANRTVYLNVQDNQQSSKEIKASLEKILPIIKLAEIRQDESLIQDCINYCI